MRLAKTCLLIATLFLAIPAMAQAPFSVIDGLFDQSNDDSLGLAKAPGTETFTIFAPNDTTDQFSNGVVMIPFQGQLYCMWQSSAKDEDAADTRVAYSVSSDGTTWTDPMVLVPSPDNGYVSSGGWWVYGDTLVAYINTWPDTVSPRGGYTQFCYSTDGQTWTAPEPLLMANGDTLMGIFEQDPKAHPSGRIINAAHFQPGILINPIYTDDPSGMRGWVKADFTILSQSGGVSREIEPSWYLRSDGAVVMTFRDQNGTYKRLASVSADTGATWTQAVLTNMPDSRSKQSAGNLPDGNAYLVGNPRDDRLRIPLAITLSIDGFTFKSAYLLRKGGDGIQPLRYEGTAKRLGYHYPKTIIWNDTVYVSYATNKEDVEYTRVPVAALTIDTTASIWDNRALLENNSIRIQQDVNKLVRISILDQPQRGTVRILNLNGQEIAREDIRNGDLLLDLKRYPAGTYVLDVRTDRGRKAKLVGNW